jgi:hypothetical protein
MGEMKNNFATNGARRDLSGRPGGMKLPQTQPRRGKTTIASDLNIATVFQRLPVSLRHENADREPFSLRCER